MSPHRAANEHQTDSESSFGRTAERHMAGKRQTAWIAIAMAGQMVAASVAAAQSVPLPPPAPLPKTGAAPGGAPQPPGSIPNAKGPSTTAQAGGQKAQSGEQQAQSGSPLQQLQQWLP